MSEHRLSDLGPYWVQFIERMVESDRYANASEVVSAALRLLEEREHKWKPCGREKE